MPDLTHKTPVACRGALAALFVLAWLALSACLPLQFGVERPSTATSPATPAAVVTGSASVTAAPIASASPTATLDGRTPITGVTATPSPTASATEFDAATSGAATATLTPTNRPTGRPIGECELTHTVRQGERLFAIGALYGVRWQDIASLNNLADPGLIFAGQVLCLPPGARPPSTPTRTPTPTASVSPSPTTTGTPSTTPDLCLNAPAWFFTPEPDACPAAAAVTSQAAAQRFEHGQMLWVGAVDQYFVLYDGASAASPAPMEFVDGPLNLKPGASVDNRVPETPPAGLQQPVSGFGLIWRGEVVGAEAVRESLGWATQAEFAYTTPYQCAATSNTAVNWSCYLRLPNGSVVEALFDSGSGYEWLPVE